MKENLQAAQWVRVVSALCSVCCSHINQKTQFENPVLQAKKKLSQETAAATSSKGNSDASDEGVMTTGRFPPVCKLVSLIISNTFVTEKVSLCFTMKTIGSSFLRISSKATCIRPDKSGLTSQLWSPWNKSKIVKMYPHLRQRFNNNLRNTGATGAVWGSHVLQTSSQFPSSLVALSDVTHPAQRNIFFQRSVGEGWENILCLYLPSNLYVIMQMHFTWSMQQCGHLVFLWTVINYSPSHQFVSAVDGFWLTAEQCDRLSRVYASEFFWR